MSSKKSKEAMPDVSPNQSLKINKVSFCQSSKTEILYDDADDVTVKNS